MCFIIRAHTRRPLARLHSASPCSYSSSLQAGIDPLNQHDARPTNHDRLRPAPSNLDISSMRLAQLTCVSFVFGCACSCAAGSHTARSRRDRHPCIRSYVGLWISVRCNVRVASVPPPPHHPLPPYHTPRHRHLDLYAADTRSSIRSVHAGRHQILLGGCASCHAGMCEETPCRIDETGA